MRGSHPAEVYVAADRAVNVSMAAQPPLVITPRGASGYPSHRRNQSITTASGWLGALTVNHVAGSMLKPVAR